MAGLGIACALVLLLILSYTGPFSTIHVPQNSGNMANLVTQTASSTSAVVPFSNSSRDNFTYASGTSSQAVSTTTTFTATETTSTPISTETFGSATPVFALEQAPALSPAYRISTFVIFGILAAVSVVVALASIYFVRKTIS